MPETKDYQFAIAVSLVALSGFLFLCLISCHPADLEFFSTAASRMPFNYGGIIGARIASALFLLFGKAAHLLSPVLFFSGLLVYLYGISVPVVVRIVSGFAFVAVAALFPGLLAPSSEAGGVFHGLLSREISERFLLLNLGKQGSLLIVSTFALSLFMFFSRLNLALIKQGLSYPAAAINKAVELLSSVYRMYTKHNKIHVGRQTAEMETAKIEEAPVFKEPKGTHKKEKAKKSLRRFLPKKDEKEEDLFNEVDDDELPLTRFVADEDSDYELPTLSLLDDLPPARNREIKEDLSLNSKILEDTLRDFGIDARVVGATKGPVITCYELHPAPGVKVQRIVSLQDDLALALKAVSIRILAPIPGKAAVGIEVPNSKAAVVYLRELLSSEPFRKSRHLIPLVLGKDLEGNPLIADLTEMPHLLIAGSTGSGKTVCVNAIITGMLYMASPQRIKFVMIDPKIVEMADYRDIPHLVCPIVSDPKKAGRVLQWLVREMEQRYELLAKAGVRNIKAFNERDRSMDPAPDAQPELCEPLPGHLPYIVVIIEELADLMLVAPVDIESSIVRLAQMSRAVGIHLIIATQRPSVDVLTGIIKANFPARISFKVASKVDSRTILDANGADKLLGKGDLLFLPPGTSKLCRAQGAFVQDREIKNIVSYIRGQRDPEFIPELEKKITQSEDDDAMDEIEAVKQNKDSLYDAAVKVVRTTGQASVSMIQRKLRIGYTRAARIMDMMEDEGIVGAPDPVSKTRELLFSADDID